jgi:hypothetical protein
MIVIVTGSRSVTVPQSDVVIQTLATVWPLSRLFHGACPFGGVDKAAHVWAWECRRIAADQYPAKAHTGAEFRARNVRMVNDAIALADATGLRLRLFAFPTEGSRGTWHCLNYAKSCGVSCTAVCL